MKLRENKKVFLSYAWTGEDQEAVKSRMQSLTDYLKRSDVTYYYNKEDEDIKDFASPGQFVADAIKKLAGCDRLLVIKASERRSEGQLMEVGAALTQGIPVTLLLHESARGSTYLDDEFLSEETAIWSDEDDLVAKLEALV